MYNSQSICCKEICWTIRKASAVCCKRVVVFFGKHPLQEGCFHTQVASVARMLLSSKVSVTGIRTCSLQEGCFSVQKMPVARGLLFSSEGACCKGCCTISKVSVYNRIAVLVLYWLRNVRIPQLSIAGDRPWTKYIFGRWVRPIGKKCSLI
jgi:hypothetical protein